MKTYILNSLSPIFIISVVSSNKNQSLWSSLIQSILHFNFKIELEVFGRLDLKLDLKIAFIFQKIFQKYYYLNQIL